MTLKKDTRRDLGKRLVNREKAVWEENGWLIDSNLRWVWTKAGMRTVTITDYFGLYDFLAAWPEGGIMALVQVSAKGEGDHKPPLGFPFEQWQPRTDVLTPDDLLPRHRYFVPGVYEIFVYYRKLKASDEPRSWTPDRRWWVRHHPPGTTPDPAGGGGLK